MINFNVWLPEVLTGRSMSVDVPCATTIWKKI